VEGLAGALVNGPSSCKDQLYTVL